MGTAQATIEGPGGEAPVPHAESGSPAQSLGAAGSHPKGRRVRHPDPFHRAQVQQAAAGAGGEDHAQPGEGGVGRLFARGAQHHIAQTRERKIEAKNQQTHNHQQEEPAKLMGCKIVDLIQHRIALFREGEKQNAQCQSYDGCRPEYLFIDTLTEVAHTKLPHFLCAAAPCPAGESPPFAAGPAPLFGDPQAILRSALYLYCIGRSRALQLTESIIFLAAFYPQNPSYF